MKIDVKEILTEADIAWHENRTHVILKRCPNCDGEDKLWVDKRNHLWQCFKCKGDGNDDTKSGNLRTLLRKVVGLDKNQIDRLMKDGEELVYTQETVQETKIDMTPQVITREVKGYQLASNFFKLDCTPESIKRFPEAYKYLFNRHVNSKKVIMDFDLRFDPAQKRVVFPAYIDKNTCVGYQGRDITDRNKIKHPKCQNHLCSRFSHYYFVNERTAPENCPECGKKVELNFYPKSVNNRDFPKTEIFFNQQNIDWNIPVNLVEGPFDCITTPNSLGLLGRVLSPTQLELLRNNAKSIVLYLDGDEQGTESIKIIYSQLILFVRDVTVCLLQDKEDPGSFTREANTLKLLDKIDIETWCIAKNQLIFF